MDSEKTPLPVGPDEGDEPAPPGVHAASIVRWAIIVVAIAVALWSVLSWAGAFRAVRGEHEGHAQATARETYQCPMHPTVVSDRPGQCPICNMTLQKVETESPAPAMTGGTSQVPGLATVTFTEDKIQKSGVRTATVERRILADPVRTIALVSADEGRLAKVQTRFSGWIERLRVNETGQKVAAGEVLAEIFSRELFTAQQEYLSSIRWSKDGAATNDSLSTLARQRLELLGIAPAEIAAIEKSGQPIRALPIRAPSGGYVTFKGVVEGAFVDPGTELFEIADLSRVWAWAEVYERDLARIRIGQSASLRVPAVPGRTFEGKVTFLQPLVDPRTRTVRARVELPNPKLTLKPGMYGDVEIAADSREGLVIPRDALVDTGDHQYVFVEVAPMRFQPRTVKAGTRGESVLILEGLAEGETVVTSGNFLVDSESRRRATAMTTTQESAGKRSDIPIDPAKFPQKYEQWLECERVHRGMGSMAEDCQNAIPKPWK